LNNQRSNRYLLLPVLGFCLFIILYVIAASLYPGGSEINLSAKSFSWKHNYWCDLLETHAENGEPNTARTTAIVAMAVLCISIALFWYFVPRLFTFKPFSKKLIQFTGVISMGILVFLQANFHDIIINIAGASGVIALTGTLIGLYKNRSYFLFVLGVVCVFLLFLNNYIYYTKQWLYYLPVVQKLSFILFLLWFSLISVRVFQRAKIHG
jgi:hypothetical protein